MKKLFALLALFRQGAAVTDPALWKKRQITATVLLPFFAALVATARAFGHEIPVTDEEILQVVTGLVVLINLVFTVTTSRHIGLPPVSKTAAEHDLDPGQS